jgi:Na+-driven multidrug efflux pump
MIFLGSVGVFFIFFSEPVVRLFTHDLAVIPLGAACLRIVSYGNLGYAYFMVMMQAFNGAGDTVTPTMVNFFGFWLFEIPLAYCLAIPLHMALERCVLCHCACGGGNGGGQRDSV